MPKIDWGDMPVPPSKEELEERGMSQYLIDRSTHPDYYVSNWPVVGADRRVLGAKARYRMPHINYQSVLITVISNRWLEGGWHRLQDMIRFTEKQGFHVALEEVDDMSVMPGDAIGIMRACAAMLALDSGFEWCLMLDTDTQLEEDTLVRLLAHDRPIVYPLIRDIENRYPGAPLSGPILPRGQGLQPVTWATMCCMLFNTKIFNCLSPYAWHGHDYHFAQCLAHYGHRIMVDTDTVVNVSRSPGRHPMKPWNELWKDIEVSRDKGLHEDRDRRPPPDFDPVFGEGYVSPHDGVYWADEGSAARWRVNGPNQPHKQGTTDDLDTNTEVDDAN